MKQNKFIKKFLFVAVMAFAISVFLGEASSYAAAKAELEEDSRYIAINEVCNIVLNGKVKKATYQFTSKNKKVATVSKKGAVKGISYGKTKIVVTQKLKKKTTKVGTFTVTVKKAVIWADYESGIWVANQPGIQKENPFTMNIPEYINFRNKKATYSVYSSNTSKLSITKKGVVKDVNGEGNVKITFKETYKGKTRTVGSVKCELKSPTYTGKKDVEIAVSETYSMDEYLEAVGRYYLSFSEDNEFEDPNDVEKSDGDDVIKFVHDSNGDWNGDLNAVGEGKRYVRLYAYDYNQKKIITTPFAEFTIIVKKIENAEKIETEFDREPDDYEEIYSKDTDTYNMYMNRTREFAIYQTPYNYTGEIKVTSSDPDIVKAAPFEKNNNFVYDYDDMYDYDYGDTGYIGKMILIPVKEGNAKITIEANGAKRTFNVKVNESPMYTGDGEYYASVMLDKAIDNSDGKVSLNDFEIKSSNSSIAKAELDDYFVDSGIIRVASFDVYTGEKSGKVTFTITYKGEKVGKLTVNVLDNSDDDYDYDDDYDDDEY